MPFSLPSLPFKRDALEPHMSAETLDYHHAKHHQAYVDKLNTLIPGTAFETESLDHIIDATENDATQRALFNNAAQIAHHTFFWHSLTPNGGGAMKDGPLLKEIVKRFGSFEAFLEAFSTAACAQFGSGWAWTLINEAGDLDICTTSNADKPAGKLLLTCDVWEHAYYIDHRNRRPGYVKLFLDHLANWGWMEDNFKNA
jgi:Fe-Mn family superoxide dismutase